jgi:hypothetical protein
MKLSNSVKYENIVGRPLWSPPITRKQGFIRCICRAKARLGSILFICVGSTLFICVVETRHLIDGDHKYIQNGDHKGRRYCGEFFMKISASPFKKICKICNKKLSV